MIGISIPSSRLRRFEAATGAAVPGDGRCAALADAEIEELLRAAHPEAHFEGVEPDVPAFP